MNNKVLFYLIPLLFLPLLWLIGCSNPLAGGRADKNIVQVDTIVYETLIHNIDASEPWKNEWLKHLNRKEFIDQLFQAVYDEKAKAIDYFSKEPMSLNDVKAWEESNAREAIGKLQFTEKWIWNSSNGEFTKEIIAILPAYESFTDSGELRGYKAGLQIVLK